MTIPILTVGDRLVVGWNQQELAEAVAALRP